MPAENYWESHQTLFDIPTVSTDSHKSFSQTPSPSHIFLSLHNPPVLHHLQDPAPIPTQVSRAETGSFGSNNARKKVNEFSSFANSSQYSQSPKLTRGTMKSSAVSQIDELEDFAMEGLYGDEFETNSVAAASTAAMKEAMDRAEPKFKHAKGVREREVQKLLEVKKLASWIEMRKQCKMLRREQSEKNRRD
ncbi:hypothetical protein AAG906_022700 [Vitis piasezkii]